MERKTFALYTLIVGALVGLVAEVLFYGKLIGVSFPLFMLIGIAVVLASKGLLRQPIHLHNLWVLVPALFFACMVAVRADWQIRTLNIGAAFALSALALHYLPLSERLDLDAFADHVLATLDATLGAIVAPMFEALDSVLWLSDHLHGNRHVLTAVGRGLVITLPVVAVFALLLASADAVFAEYVNRVVGLLEIRDFTAPVYQIGFIGMIGWVSCGTVAYGVARRERLQHKDKPKRKLPSLGMIEACITLASVDLLFGLFVIIQFAYFFGGRSTLSVDGMTYSEYARRGFFELVAVSVLTLGLVLALDGVTLRRAQQHTNTFRVFALILVALTAVILVSASQRMLLYEEQFGYTVLRVYTDVFIGWLTVLFVFFVLALFRVRMRIFSLGVLVVLIGFLGTLDLMNVEGYVTERNIARVQDGYDLDFSYLSTFSVDAAPAILNLYQTTNSPELRASAGQWLAGALFDLDSLRQADGSTFFSANLARDTTWAALDSIRASLPKYHPTYFYSGE